MLEFPNTGRLTFTDKSIEKAAGRILLPRPRCFSESYHHGLLEHTRCKPLGGFCGWWIQIHSYPESSRPDPGRSPYRGDPDLLCLGRLLEQQDRTLLAQDGDPG